MSRRGLVSVIWGALLLVAPPAAAQESVAVDMPDFAPPAHVSIVDGTATLAREGRSEPAVANMPLLEGDRLETARGRLEVFFPDGSVLHLDEYSTLDLLSGTLLRLLNGRAIVLAAGRGGSQLELDFQVDTPAGSVRLLMPGQYRISLFSGPEVEVAVVRGEAALATSRASTQARSGERVYAREGEVPSSPMAFNSARWDGFEVWSDQQRRAEVGYESARYLPEEVDQYAYMFDRYGSWREREPYGRVWYPTVAVDWRPYYHGYWQPYDSWGWFWIGYDPWGWPTHHYGRWGFDGGWYWIPHRRFGPSWVSWGISALHVSWCPLGWDNRPVFGLFADTHYVGGRAYDSWRAWTVVPRHAFGSAVRTSAVAIRGGSLDTAVRRSFIVQNTAPRAPQMAMSRPIGAAGGRPGGSDRAVPRASIGQPSGGGGGFAASPGDRPSAVPRSGAGGPASRPGVTASAPATRAAPRGGIADRTGEPATANRFGSGTSWPADRTGAARPRAGGMASPSAGSGGGSAAARERDYWPSRQTPRATPGSPGSGGGTSAGAVPRRSTPSGSAGTVGRAPSSTYGATRAPSGSPGTWRTPGAAAAQPRDRTPAGAGGGSTYSSPVPRTYERTTPRSSAPLPGANERRGSGSSGSMPAYPRSAPSQTWSRPEPSSAPRSVQPSWSRPESSAPRFSQPSSTPRSTPAIPRGVDRGMSSRPSASHSSGGGPSVRSAPSAPRSAPSSRSGGQGASRSPGSAGGGGSRARPRK